MNFLADENVDRQIVERLRKDGHVLRYVVEMKAGISDDMVLDLANKESSLLITADKDFGKLVFRQRLIMHGIVLIRLAGIYTIVQSRDSFLLSTNHNSNTHFQ